VSGEKKLRNITHDKDSNLVIGCIQPTKLGKTKKKEAKTKFN
jgi:hypothetical protein